MKNIPLTIPPSPSRLLKSAYWSRALLAMFFTLSSLANAQLLISQYYEGTGTNKWIELQNVGASPVLLDGYVIALWSNNSREAWKTTATPNGVVSLPTGTSVPPGGYFLIKNSANTIPAYAASGPAFSANAAANFNGDDSVVLYNGTPAVATIADAFSVKANTAPDISWYRISTAVGYDLTAGTDYTNYPTVWASKTLTEVANAVSTDPWYLTGLTPTETLTLAITPDTFSENAGSNVAVGTVTRTGNTSTALTVTIAVSDASEAVAPTSVVIPIGELSATFDVSAVDDLAPDGNVAVTVTVTATGFTSGTKVITVNDDGDVFVAPQILISQYYEGANSDKYIELHNITASPVTLTGYKLTSWANAASETWKTGATNPTNTLNLDAVTIPANGYYLVKNTDASEPLAVSPGADIASTVTFFNGDDSVVLFYQGVTPALGAVADALSFPSPGTTGAETSFYRLTNDVGFNTTLGSTPLDFPAVWGQKTPAEVIAATPADDFYLKSGNPNGPLALSLSPASVSEGAVGVASVGTVTRTGDLSAELIVTLSSNDTTEATVPATVTILATEASATFEITAVEDTDIDGPVKVTISTSANGFVNGLATLTVQDNESTIVTINEVLSDPADDITGDANGDGVRSGTADEFIELVNTSGASIDMSGWVIIDATNNPVHIFPAATVLAAGQAIVVFGGNTPTGTFGGAIVQVASAVGGLSFNNGGDTIILLDSSQAIIDVLTYGSEGDANQSRNLSPDITGDFANHSSIANASGALFSPGTKTDGTPFGSSPGNSYSNWASTNTGSGSTSATGDHDNDGVSNGVEFFMGATGSTFTPNPVPDANRLLSIPASATATGVTGIIQTSPDLVTWTTLSSTTAGGFISATIPAPDAGGKIFARLNVVVTTP